jgi:excinuclease ABC subunit C
MTKFKFLKKNKLSSLPRSSGVYCFKEKREFLYIGKASDIRERVKNHFQGSNFRDNLFINRTTKVDYIKTGSEIEALILEANLIKKHQPKYNVVWRDDKNYFYVGITKEDYPAVFFTHQTKEKAEFIGPFVDGKSLKAALKILRKVFPYRTCRILPRRPCLWYQIKRCPAPCLLKTYRMKTPQTFGKKLKKEYQRNIKNLLKILRGKKNQVLKGLEKEMKIASKKEMFEEAAKIRDQIESLERVLFHAKIFETEKPLESDWSNIQKVLKRILNLPIKKKIVRIEAYDISNIQGKEATGSMVAFRKGLPDKKSYRRFKVETVTKPNDIAMLKECLKRRFKHLEWEPPDLILIDGGLPQLNTARKSKLQNKNFKNIPVIALAKRKNELYLERRKKPILLKNLPREIFNLILQLRDEAHRFAITYHRKLRTKDLPKE